MILLHKDERGTMWRGYDDKDHSVLVCNEKPWTMRGIHWQDRPAQRSKVFTVLAGAAQLVVADLFTGIHEKVEVFPGKKVYITADQACGYLTLEPRTLVHYEMTRPYVPEAERGVRWNDPYFGIDWIRAPVVINERDASWPDFVPAGKL